MQPIMSALLQNFRVSLRLLLFLLAEVALVIEVTEEDNKNDAVSKHYNVHTVWKVTLGEQVVACMQEEHHKLHL